MIFDLIEMACGELNSTLEKVRIHRRAKCLEKQFYLSKALGSPKLKPVTLPSYSTWTVKKLRKELTDRKIKGRSKARTKKQLIQLLAQGRK